MKIENPSALSPTDISQYLRLKSCERFLWFRLQERSTGEDIVESLGGIRQSISPLLREAGQQFENAIENQVARRYETIRVIASDQTYREDEHGENAAPISSLAETAQNLQVGATRVLFQVPLSAMLWGWHLTGIADLIRVGKDSNSNLHILVADIKRSGHPVTGYWIQTALYAAMISARLQETHTSDSFHVDIGILYRPDTASSDDGSRETGQRLLGINAGEAILKTPRDYEPYLWAAKNILEGSDAVARRLTSLPMADAFFCLGMHCDGCTYQEVCLRLCHEEEDLSLVRLRPSEKKMLWSVGIRTLKQLEAIAGSSEGSGNRLASIRITPRLHSRLGELSLRATASPNFSTTSTG